MKFEKFIPEQQHIDEYSELLDLDKVDIKTYERIFSKDKLSSWEHDKSIKEFYQQVSFWETEQAYRQALREYGVMFESDPLINQNPDLNNFRQTRFSQNSNIEHSVIGDTELTSKIKLLQNHFNSVEIAQKFTRLFVAVRDFDDSQLDEGRSWTYKSPLFGLYLASSEIIEKAESYLDEEGGLSAEAHAKILFLSIFGNDEEMDSSIFQEQDFTRVYVPEAREILEYSRVKGEKLTPAEVIKLASYQTSIFFALNLGYTLKDLLNYPFLIKTSSDRYNELIQEDEAIDLFPCEGDKHQQIAWCANNSLVHPNHWNNTKLGKILYIRLINNIDQSMHNASHFLTRFECPETKDNVTYIDSDKEDDLLVLCLSGPKSSRNKLPTKKTKYEQYLSSPARRFIYETLIELNKHSEPSLPILRSMIELKISHYTKSDKRKKLELSPEALSAQIDEVLVSLEEKMNSQSEQQSLPTLLRDLKQIGRNREKRIEEAQRWVLQHAQTPANLLCSAWDHREIALKEGVEDNPRDIQVWVEKQSARNFLKSLSQKLGPSFNADEFYKNNEQHLTTLLRYYDIETTVNFLQWFNENANLDSLIPSFEYKFPNGVVAEILEKDNIQGAVIGEETACCMTLNGASESCIYEGYTNPSCNFFSLRDKDGKMIAQSFIWINEEENNDVLVLDNIEANEGKDINNVLDYYKEFFAQYVKSQIEKDPHFLIKKIYVGTGYTSIGINHLPRVNPIKPPYNGYTDAQYQRLFLSIDAEA